MQSIPLASAAPVKFKHVQQNFDDYSVTQHLINVATQSCDALTAQREIEFLKVESAALGARMADLDSALAGVMVRLRQLEAEMREFGEL